LRDFFGNQLRGVEIDSKLLEGFDVFYIYVIYYTSQKKIQPPEKNQESVFRFI
jgi:hypothetical protein